MLCIVAFVDFLTYSCFQCEALVIIARFATSRYYLFFSFETFILVAVSQPTMTLDALVQLWSQQDTQSMSPCVIKELIDYVNEILLASINTFTPRQQERAKQLDEYGPKAVGIRRFARAKLGI
jgi:hypothetical protein